MQRQNAALEGTCEMLHHKNGERTNVHSRSSFCLAASILLAAAVLYLGGLWLNRAPAAYVTVSVDGEEIAHFSLNETTEYLIDGYAGGTNRLIIRDGEFQL